MNSIVSLIAPKGKVLLVDSIFGAEASRASRNLGRVSMQEASKLNTKDLCSYSKIVLSSKALDAIIARVKEEKN